MSYYRLFLIASALLITFLNPLLTKSVRAQTPASGNQITPLVLLNETQRISPDPSSLFVVKDRSRKMGFTSIIGMIQKSDIKKYSNTGSIVELGSNASPYWIVIPITNKSDKENWTLNFGKLGNGRLGFAQKAILYETASRQTFINTTSPAYTQSGEIYTPNEIPVTLKRGMTANLILYIEAHDGILTSFKPEFTPSGVVQDKLDIFKPNVESFFLIAAIVLLAGFLFKRNYSLLPLSGMWLFFFVYGEFLDHFLLIDSSLGHVIPQSFKLVFPVLLFLSLWLVPQIKAKYPSSLFIGTGVLFFICGLLGTLLSGTLPTLGAALSFAPMIGTSLIMTLLVWPLLSLHAKDPLNSFAVISVTILFTSLWVAIETIQPLQTLETMSSLCPWLLAFVAVITSVSYVTFIEKKEAVVTPENDDQNDATADMIRQAREASEHSRLLHVLEQERAAMKELQIQEARQTEEMKRAKDSADEANMAKSAFLAVVSHEIRTPMTGIMGMVRLMLDTGLSREQKEYANTIQDSGEALLSLLNDILDFEKIESGKLDLEATSFDLKRLLKGIHTLMNGHAASKNVELVLDLDEKLPDFVIGDPTRIRQVLLNLVNNAIKFTAHGAVTLHVKDLSSVETNAGATRQIYFGVQDSGIGISPEAQKKIFTPFAQADASINRKFGGTGLGLTICKRLIEAMGSSIGINSREGEGSTFFFTLPMKAASSEDASLQATHILSDLSSKKLKVLVVDDNGINQKVLQGLLGRTGHHPIVASNADDAVAAVQREAFDLVLMDIELPGKSGLDATKEIRALPDRISSRVPIVAMTGNVRPEDIQKYFSNGMNDFLGKPVMPDSLQQVLLKTARGDFAYPEELVIIPPQPAEVISEAFITPPVPENLDDEEDIFASAVREFEKSEVEETPQESHLDEMLIASLIKSLGIGQTEELLKDFYDKTEELIGAVQTAHHSLDHDATRARAHELKGMAANFGFKSLAANAGHIERIIAHKEEADIRPLLESLSGLYIASRTQMDKRLKA